MIDAPTLVIHGRRDHVVPFGLAQELRDAIVGATLTEVCGGHLFALARSDLFAEHVTAFTTGLAASASLDSRPAPE